MIVVFQVVQESLESYENTDRVKWVVSWPGQAVLCVSQSYWTKFVTESIREGPDALKKYLDLNNSQIKDIVALVRGDLSKQNRTTLGALIVLDVHSRDVLTKLVQESKSKSNTVAMNTVAMDTVAMDTVAMDMVTMDTVTMDAVAMDTIAMDTNTIA